MLVRFCLPIADCVFGWLLIRKEQAHLTNHTSYIIARLDRAQSPAHRRTDVPLFPMATAENFVELEQSADHINNRSPLPPLKWIQGFSTLDEET